MLLLSLSLAGQEICSHPCISLCYACRACVVWTYTIAWLWQVNRLELTLSIGSFAAALGAMVAGIFGMNLRSTLEDSVLGFWGTTIGIVLCCVWVFIALFTYTRRRRIL